MSQIIRDASIDGLRDLCMRHPPSKYYCLSGNDSSGNHSQHSFLSKTPADKFTREQLTTALGLLIAHTRVPAFEVPTSNDVYGPNSGFDQMFREKERRREQIATSAADLRTASEHTSAASNPGIQRCIEKATTDFERMHDAVSFDEEEIILPYQESLDSLSCGIHTKVYKPMEKLATEMTNLSPHKNPYQWYGATGKQSMDPSSLLDHQLGQESVHANESAKSSGGRYWHVHGFEEGTKEGDFFPYGGAVRSWK